MTAHAADSSIIFASLEQTDGQIIAVKYDANGQGMLLGQVFSGGARRARCSRRARSYWSQTYVSLYIYLSRVRLFGSAYLMNPFLTMSFRRPKD